MAIFSMIKNVIKGAPSFLKGSAILTAEYASKHAPQILLGVGLTGVGVGTVIACKQTLKLPNIIEETKLESSRIRESEGSTIDIVEDGFIGTAEITKDMVNKDLAALYFKTGCQIAKTYAAPVLITGLGIASICVSHSVLNRRYLAAVAACESTLQAMQALNDKFTAYRSGVIAEQGTDKDKEYMDNADKIIEQAKAQGTTVVEEICRVNGYNCPVVHEGPSRMFEEATSNLWKPVAVYNITTLNTSCRILNNRLRQRYNDTGFGWLYLWEAEEHVGLIPNEDSYKLGWIYDPAKHGDQINFGLYDRNPSKEKINFLGGIEPNVELHFNVFGNISDILTNENVKNVMMERMTY